LVITPDGSMIYAAGLQRLPAQIVAIDVESSSVAASLTANVGANSLRHMVIDLTGSRLYAATPNRILIYDTATFAEIARIDWSVNPHINRLAVSFDGGTLFANHEFAQAITPIDTATLQAGTPIGDTTETFDGSSLMMVPLGPTA
jgi:DNA-binding beta-propeller fold protein YncE